MKYWLQRTVVAPVKRALHLAAALMSTHRHDHRRAVSVQLREEVRMSGYSDIQVMGDLVRQRSAAAAAAVAMNAAAGPPPPARKEERIMKKIKKKPGQKRSSAPAKSYWASCISSRAI